MKKTGFEKRTELKNRALSSEMKFDYEANMIVDDIQASGDQPVQNARYVINEAYRKSEGFARDIEDGNYKNRLDIEKALSSISDRICMAEEKNRMEAKKL